MIDEQESFSNERCGILDRPDEVHTDTHLNNSSPKCAIRRIHYELSQAASVGVSQRETNISDGGQMSYESLKTLLEILPDCRALFLYIIDVCEGGCTQQALSQLIGYVEQDTPLDYSPMMLCRILEQVGALVAETSFAQTFQTEAEEPTATGFLSDINPSGCIWYATSEALQVYRELSQGAFLQIKTPA